jgi:protein TonB
MKLEKLRSLFLLLAMTTTLSLTYAFMNVRTYETSEKNQYLFDEEFMDSLLPPPLVAIVPPPPPVDPITKTQKIKNPALLDLTDKTIEPEPQEALEPFDPDEFVEGVEGGDEPLDKIPPAIEPPRYYASKMPYFESCGGLASNQERNECTKRIINDQIKRCFQTPDFLREMNFAGDVAVQFIVNENGTIENIHIIHSDHELLNKAAIQSVGCLPKFQPGEHNGQKVKVIYQQNIRLKN